MLELTALRILNILILSHLHPSLPGGLLQLGFVRAGKMQHFDRFLPVVFYCLQLNILEA
jgi:hypothetical protein